MHRLLLLPLAVVLIGCRGAPDEPTTVTGFRDLALAARDEAKAARDAKDPDAAGDAADRAEDAAGKAADLLKATPQAAAGDKAACEKAAAAARDARLFAELAEEEKRLTKLTSGLKAKAYRGARKVALVGVFTALSLAADQAGKADLASLPEPVQDNARLAAEMAAEYAGREPLPDGQPDWPGIALDLGTFRSQPPVELPLLGALALVLSAQNRFALYEIELVDPQALKTRDQKMGYHALRGVILSLNDLPHLAVQELEKASTLATEGEKPPDAPQLLAGIHLWLAYMYLEENEYRKADLELVRAIRLWPDSSVSVFLTGERLAASGEYEKAADSLEAMARGTSEERLARRIAERARQLRDQPGEAEPLLTDAGFLRDLTIHFIWEAAKESEAAAQLKQSITTAKQFGRRMLEKLTGAGIGK